MHIKHFQENGYSENYGEKWRMHILKKLHMDFKILEINLCFILFSREHSKVFLYI